MGNKWPLVKFKSLYQIPSRNGLTKPKSVRGEGFKFINMGEIFSYSRMFKIPCDRVPLTEKERITSLLEIGDLLFARQSLVLSGAGKCSIFLGDDEEVVFESHLIRVRLNQEKINPEYAYYYFNSAEGRANISTIVEQGAGQAGIRGSDLENIDFPLPPKIIQDLIVNTIRPTDIKIEVNHQINQTLEQMAQTLFKSWFVDFDPVIDNALDAGNDIPEPLQARAELRQKVRARQDFQPLPADVRALFPAEFEESELGWVPKGWDVQALGDMVTVKRGGSPRPIHDFLASSGLPWIKISDATASNSRFITGTKEFIKKEGLNKTVYLKKGELILSNSATPGLPKFIDLDACIHDGWLYFPQKHHLTDLYLYQLFLEIRPSLVQQGNGSVFVTVHRDCVDNNNSCGIG